MGDSHKKRVISIRWILSAAAIVLTTITVSGLGVFSERSTRRALTHELLTRLVFQARNLAMTSSGALLSDFPELTLAPIIAEMRENQSDLAFAVVVDLDNVIRGHADARMIGEPFELASTLVPTETVTGVRAGERVLADRALLVATASVRHAGGDPIGTAVVAVQRRYVDSIVADARRQQLVLVTALLAVGVLATTIFMSILLRPVDTLRKGLERIGRGDLETPVQLRDRTEFGLLAETMNEMSKRLREAQDEHVEKERLAREVELAREIQSSLLPSVETRANQFVIDGAHRAAAEVGGDYYDVFPLSDGKIGTVIADVSGKGLAGCLVTSMLSAVLRAYRDTETSPSSLIVRLENTLRDSLRPGTFITMFYGILDPMNGNFTFASAGHSPLMIWRSASQKAEWYKTAGIPVGAVRGGALARTLRDQRVVLGPHDLAVQYTDGINEAFEPSNTYQFGFKRMEQSVARSASLGCRGVIEAIRSDLKAWTADSPPFDDETLLVVGLEGDEVPMENPRKEVPDPLHALSVARRDGQRLSLSAEIEQLDRLSQWLGSLPGLGKLTSRAALVLETAVYEVCANVIEHGFENAARETLDLWWIPDPSDGSGEGHGYFLLRDDGVPFAPDSDSLIDFRDPSVRRRGRGIGLEIIREAMSLISYNPNTTAGNVTILGFDPARIGTEEEASHV